MYTEQKLRNLFTYHPPSKDQQWRYEMLRARALDFAHHLMSLCPESQERSKALSDLRQSIMWANAAIACNESPDPAPPPAAP